MSEREKIDLRILQANERTLLAWIRTGLALIAFGFVLARIGVWLEGDDQHASDATMSMSAGIVFIVVGTLVHPVAAFRFARARRAIVDRREIIPDAATAIALSIAVALLGAALVTYLATR